MKQRHQSTFNIKTNTVQRYFTKFFRLGLARLGWLKHFPASAQLKIGSASAQTFFG